MWITTFSRQQVNRDKMSLRNDTTTVASPSVVAVRNGLNAMRAAEIQAQRDAELRTEVTSGPSEAGLRFQDLSPTERSAASLGVDPSDWKPISFLNTSHYSTLLKSNVLDGPLAQKIEAYKSVAAGGS